MGKSLEEMCRLVTGYGTWHIGGNHVSDGPHGIRAQEDGYISTRDIVTMDWLADNVVGRIPAAHELSERAQKLIHSDKA